MVEYKTQFEEVSIGGTLYKLHTAERMISELEKAVQKGKFHQELNEDIKYNNRALDHLLSPTDKDHILKLDLSVDIDGYIPEEYFENIEEDRELGGSSNMRVFVGTVQACDIKEIHNTIEGLISFEVEIPNFS
jgi:hypothetical protein